MAILTVYTRLLDKTLEGARIIDMGSTKTCQCYVLPYEKVSKIGKTYLTGKYAFYILLGSNTKGEQCAYIGQTNDFTSRVIDHKQKKDWWDTALVFVSKADEIFASEVMYLEYLGWKLSLECKNYHIENTKQIKEPGLSEDKKNDMELFFEEIKFLTKFYGCNVFETREQQKIENASYEIFFLNVGKRAIHAEIQYFPLTKKYILKEGSTISAIATSCHKNAQAIREKIINNPECCKREGNVIRVIADTEIPVDTGKPSLPCEVVTGTAMQGPKLLKNKHGKTFAELYPNS